MVPIELSWLNEKICELEEEECPVDLPEAFHEAWERVLHDLGEGCVTVNGLKQVIRRAAA